MNTTIAVLTPAMSLGDAGELSTLVEAAGFAEVSVVARSHTVREPRTPQLVARIFPSVAAVLPTFASMSEQERSALAQAVQSEIDLALERYTEGDEQLYPMSVHIALARKQ